MPSLVTDTHALVWYIGGIPRLSSTAFKAFSEVAATTSDFVYVPTICLVELQYLLDKGRLQKANVDLIRAAVADPTSIYRLAPLDEHVAAATARVSRDSVPDMPDRIVAATALHLDLPLVSRDLKIRAAAVKTIW
jgi:PIN domain nuclease of toxin-antitoxin system